MQDPERYERVRNNSSTKITVEVYVPKILNTMTWKTGENLLDYGSGAGSTGYNWVLPKVEECNSHMYSVDVSPKMLAYAKQHFPHDRITYGLGNILDWDGLEFPFRNVKFDKIIAINVFHFIRHMRTALAGLHRILKPGGQIGFTIALADCCIFQAFTELAESESWKNYMRDYRRFYPQWSEFPKGEEHKAMTELMESCGFKVVQMEFILRSYQFDTIEDFLDLSLSLNPCIDNIPKSLHGALKEDIRKIYTRNAGIPRDSKQIDFQYRFIWGVVEKAMVGKRANRFSLERSFSY
ncbi:Juvenile hormone acid O-methyltransferase [Orchesella cincta]|uniref:Juvenile hormone acid O-methyltransferase n=1 Tax=Orchesella cincta TaxID=48709 RepID=A0A1D2MPW8_ORCCI|nr:Juvenile hormone acid O-methyltransferase [Orchesella cincta]